MNKLEPKETTPEINEIRDLLDELTPVEAPAPYQNTRAIIFSSFILACAFLLLLLSLIFPEADRWLWATAGGVYFLVGGLLLSRALNRFPKDERSPISD